MNKKNCSICVYADGVRADGSIKCTDGIRQRDNKVTDCCIPVAPLRELQSNTNNAIDFANVTSNYVIKEKLKSAYWRTNSNNLE